MRQRLSNSDSESMMCRENCHCRQQSTVNLGPMTFFAVFCLQCKQRVKYCSVSPISSETSHIGRKGPQCSYSHCTLWQLWDYSFYSFSLKIFENFIHVYYIYYTFIIHSCILYLYYCRLTLDVTSPKSPHTPSICEFFFFTVIYTHMHINYLYFNMICYYTCDPRCSTRKQWETLSKKWQDKKKSTYKNQ